MNSLAQRSTPVWVGDGILEALEASPLTGDVEADVVVVGAGIAGLSIAYELACTGRSVVVLDAGRIGGGVTARTTAHLSNALDDRWQELIRLRGLDDARLAAESHGRAIDRIGEIVAAENVDCDFVRLDGYLFPAPGDDPGILDRELEAAHRVGLSDVTKVAEAPLAKAGAPPALCFPRQGRFHPLRYLAGLAAGIKRRGRIRTTC
jgi:glycine/D-amino acid oxidase-like deaminating enzyme